PRRLRRHAASRQLSHRIFSHRALGTISHSPGAHHRDRRRTRAECHWRATSKADLVIACRNTVPPLPTAERRQTRQVDFRSWFINGSERMRLPVAAKIALSTAGAATAIVGSPTPPQKSPVGMMTTSTFGIPSIRITLYASKLLCSIAPPLTVHSP